MSLIMDEKLESKHTHTRTHTQFAAVKGIEHIYYMVGMEFLTQFKFL